MLKIPRVEIFIEEMNLTLEKKIPGSKLNNGGCGVFAFYFYRFIYLKFLKLDFDIEILSINSPIQLDNGDYIPRHVLLKLISKNNETELVFDGLNIYEDFNTHNMNVLSYKDLKYLVNNPFIWNDIYLRDKFNPLVENTLKHLSKIYFKNEKKTK
jgi:hypothetical protein